MQAKNDLRLAALAAATKAIELLGGPVEAARKVGAPSYQAVQSWEKSGVPARHCRKVSELSGMALFELRPHDWQAYWTAAEAETPGAPEAAHA